MSAPVTDLSQFDCEGAMRRIRKLVVKHRGHWITAQKGDVPQVQGRRHDGTFKRLAITRVIWYVTHGAQPECVIRTCGNQRCVRPEHLAAGNWSVCSTLAVSSKRKLTDEQVAELQRWWQNPRRYGDTKEMALRLGISLSGLWAWAKHGMSSGALATKRRRERMAA